ncbi:MAG: hypothetical protein IPN94_09985 [Sphingobacteriales bacterium]|nr:hypothetical protein [Sphingobacteriales bacterium]
MTGVSAGTSVITYKNNNGCTQTATVTIDPLPTVNAGSDVAIWNGAKCHFIGAW